MAAKERGDEDLAEYLASDIAKISTVAKDAEGGTYLPELSGFTNIALATGRFSSVNDFRNNIHKGPPEHTFTAPLLAEAPYPDVVVAKAWSNGDDLDLVFYPGTEGARVTVPLDLERLKPGEAYVFGDSRVVASETGKAKMMVTVEGRTPVHIVPA